MKMKFLYSGSAAAEVPWFLHLAKRRKMVYSRIALVNQKFLKCLGQIKTLQIMLINCTIYFI